MNSKWKEMTSEERDKLIAGKVMHRSKICNTDLLVSRHDNPDRSGKIAFTYYTWNCPTCGYKGSGSEPLGANTHINNAPIPAYTTDMNAAMQVVRRMNEIGGPADCQIYSDFIEALERLLGSDMLFDLFFYDNQTSTYHLNADVICHASLEAVGYEEKA